MRRRRIYIAGPLSTGDRLANVEAACEVARELIRQGYAPLCPHLTHYLDNDDSFGHAVWMEVDLPWVAVADALLRLPGYSRGADLEVMCARSHNIPVYDSLEELQGDMSPSVHEIPAAPAGGDPRFHAVLAEMAALHTRKAKDYGRGADVFANVRASEEFGVPAWKGCLVRFNDKVHRLKSFCLNGALANEGVEDTLLDAGAYAIISLILFREAEGQK